MMILPLIAIGVVVWLLMSQSRRERIKSALRGDGGRRDPIDIAKERYAKGEITKEEFEQIKRDLS